MLKPKMLQYGDTIGVVAPASPLEKNEIEIAKKVIEKLGFCIKLGKYCYEQHGYFAGKDEFRSYDINEMFADPDVDVVMCLRGGYGTLRILDQLDYKMIRNHPKIFIGYSDITAVHIALQQKCGLVTFHGPMAVSDFVEGMDAFSISSFKKSLMYGNCLGRIDNPKGTPIHKLVGGIAEGQIVGGNLTLICATLGTPYEIDTQNKLLLLEDVDEEPYCIDRLLTQLALAGKLEQAAGFILGSWKNCTSKQFKKSLSLLQIFEEILLPYQKPTLYNFMIGHCSPMITVPLGVNAVLDGEQCILNIVENAVINKR